MGTSRLSGVRTVARAITDGHVSVVFQPIVDTNTGAIFAYEALARSSAKGLDNPTVLFEAAAEQKLCGRLGRVLRELAVSECQNHPLFFNVHPHELADRWLVQPNDPIFSHEPGVFLEVTESVPLSHFELVKKVLSEVRGKGVGLVVDDLGAGYSNLRYIADLAPEVVKLDRGLIERLHEDPRRLKLVTSIVRLCEDLGARVVAEGIETLEELAAVREAGAHFVQGFLIARPELPAPQTSEASGLSTPTSRRRAPAARDLTGPMPESLRKRRHSTTSAAKR